VGTIIGQRLLSVFWGRDLERRKRVSEEDVKEKGGSDSWSAEQWHEVKKGDTLSKIAERYYGDGSLYMKIFEANRNILRDPNLIKIGQKLRIP
jgi:nucleoid-associated protein YgaU